MKLLTALPLLGALALISLGQTARAEHFDVDTTTLVGQSGYLDFQFNPNTDGTTPLDSSVKVSNFTGGTLGAVDTAVNVSGTLSTGTLPDGATISNAGSTNELVQLFTFGKTLGFDTSFPFLLDTKNILGSFAVPDAGNTFQFFVLDASKDPFATTDTVNNALVQISQGADGSLAPSQQYRLNAPASVPEPSSGVSLMLLSALVLIPVGLAVRKQRKLA